MHRGGRTESFATLEDIPPTLEAVIDYLVRHDLAIADEVTVEPYMTTAGEDTNVVMVGDVPWAFAGGGIHK